MCRIASKLNLARHLVKGESDIGPKSLYHTVDLKCYKKEDKFGTLYYFNIPVYVLYIKYMLPVLIQFSILAFLQYRI